MNYLENLNEDVKEYFKILSPEFPQWLLEYINTFEMQRLDGICQICGAYWKKENIYQNLYSVLNHSIGVALIVWNFTQNKKQTIAGLLHDIASPAFKHCIDFLNGDAKTQESTEEQTYDVINNSKEIMNLLDRDKINIDEICDYKIYPVADNKTPKLSADRLEYTFMNGFYYKKVWNLADIKKIYNDIKIFKNEENISELGFKTLSIAEEFINGSSMLWPLWVSAEDTLTMYFFAEILKKLIKNGYISNEDLYKLSEQEILEIIKNKSNKNISNNFKAFMNCKEFIECEEPIENKFCVPRNAKRRYINPLVQNERVYNVSNLAKSKIDGYLNMKISKYAYVDL